MNAQGSACVNHKKNKYSYIVLIDTDAGFSGATRVVDPVFDDTNPLHVLEWTPTITSQTTTRLKVRLKCTAGRPFTARKKGHRGFQDTTPDAGALTVTLTNGPTVLPVPVNYVNDNTPP